MKTLGLYIHVPFCVKKCNYCDFYSIQGNDEIHRKYVADVIKSFEFWRYKLDTDTQVDTIYLGGGTPSVLGTDNLSKLLSTAASDFNISPDAEITMEVNPNSVTELDLQSLTKLGLNRISMGLQTANDDELRTLGRSHTSADATKAIEHIKKSGIDNFSLDVMTGIPLQTEESLDKTLDFCIDAKATHISTYMLKIEKNTPFYKNAENYKFADDDTHADLYEFTCNKLRENGFRHYEISNFCKDDKISRHNMKYWLLQDYLGIGPSAHSMIDRKRFFYPRNISEFQNEKVIFESEGNTPQEYLMLSLRTDTGFSFKTFEEIYGITANTKLKAEVEKFSKYGLVSSKDNSFRLTEKGFLLSNTIISQLLDAAFRF